MSDLQLPNHRHGISDTAVEAASVQMDLLRAMPAAQRLNKALALSCEMMRLSKAAIRRRHPGFTEDEVRNMFIELNYGKELADQVREWRQTRAAV